MKLDSTEYAALPRAAQYAAPLAQPPRLVVIHDTGNANSSRYNEATYAASRLDARGNWTSAHFYVDKGGVLGSLPLDQQAWSAYAYANARGWHIEICLRDLHDRTALADAARLVRTLCQRAGIPMVKLTPQQVTAGQRGVCGHWDITVGLGVGDHTDPDGEGFNWLAFMAMITDTEDDDVEQNEKVAPATPDNNTVGDALNIAVQVRRILALDDAGSGYGTPKPASFMGRVYAALAGISAKVDNIQAGTVPQDMVNAAVKVALTDPAVIGPLVKAINDDAARRAAE